MKTTVNYFFLYLASVMILFSIFLLLIKPVWAGVGLETALRDCTQNEAWRLRCIQDMCTGKLTFTEALGELCAVLQSPVITASPLVKPTAEVNPTILPSVVPLSPTPTIDLSVSPTVSPSAMPQRFQKPSFVQRMVTLFQKFMHIFIRYNFKE